MKISGIFLMKDSAGYSNFNGDAGVGCSRARINCVSAIADASAYEVLGMSKW